MLSSCIGYAIGITLDIHVLCQICAKLVLYSCVCCFLGVGSLRVLAPVCVALLFSVPFPAVLNELISENLRLIDAKIVENIGHGFGLPITRFGTIVSLNHVPVDISRDCDGLRLLWPLLLAAYTASATANVHTRVKFTMCALALPAALVLNLIRLAISTYLYGFTSAEYAATVHDILGWFLIFSAGYVPFLLIANYIEHSDYAIANNTLGDDKSGSSQATNLLPTGAVLVAGCLAIFSWQNVDYVPTKASVVELNRQIDALPYMVDKWVGEDRPVPDQEIEILKADALLQRVYYRLDSDKSVLLVAAYHLDGHAAAGHSAPKCYRTRGWQVATVEEEQWEVGRENIVGQSYEMYRGREKMTVLEIFYRPVFDGTASENPSLSDRSGPVFRYQFLVRGARPEGVWAHHLVGQFLDSFKQSASSTALIFSPFFHDHGSHS